MINIVWQSNGFRDIRVGVGDSGGRLDSGIDCFDGTFTVEETVTFDEKDREILIKAFGAGLHREHSKSWDLSDNRRLVINGGANGNMGDWAIWSDSRKSSLLRGSSNFEGLTAALFRPFKEMIFMGAGDYSDFQINELLLQVKRACELLSGVQQCAIGHDSAPEEVIKGELELQKVVRSVAFALTGREIEFK